MYKLLTTLVLLCIAAACGCYAEPTTHVHGVLKEGHLVLMLRAGDPVYDMRACIDFGSAVTVLRVDTSTWGSKTRDHLSEVYALRSSGPLLRLPTVVDATIKPDFCDMVLGMGLHSPLWMHWTGVVVGFHGIILLEAGEPRSDCHPVTAALAKSYTMHIAPLDLLFADPYAAVVECLVDAVPQRIPFFSPNKSDDAGMQLGSLLYSEHIHFNTPTVTLDGLDIADLATKSLNAPVAVTEIHGTAYENDVRIGTNLLRHCEVVVDFEVPREMTFCCSSKTRQIVSIFPTLLIILDATILILWWIDVGNHSLRVLLTIIAVLLSGAVSIWNFRRATDWRLQQMGYLLLAHHYSLLQ